MKTLHLNLTRKWFDMVHSGEKKEEYREIKKHYLSLLFNNKNLNASLNYALNELLAWGNNSVILETIKDFNTITFSNGYAKDRKQFVIEFKGIKIGQGESKWGAKSGVNYFVLELGNVLSRNF